MVVNLQVRIIGVRSHALDIGVRLTGNANEGCDPALVTSIVALADRVL